ncbi:hypothetical protein EOT10_39825 [Streptomyces antnestii]|uniref:TrbL/VirB6 plasmid conjugal transfer protein n=1 Tax=Streptomyces antnestii TaxID=2494256 RepID=A0A437NYN1_9ACTN|nr:hypothetical protein [Streptomyces sp. San01]RVU15131.1 hypothetical protein EOT10_39825 [Streptomyces sp. San01]
MNHARHCRWTTVTTVAVLTVLMIAASSAPSFAADDASSGGLLDPLNVKTPEGVPVNRYELTSSDDGPIDIALQFCMSGIFTLARTVVGFACWLIDWAYRFPILDKLAGPAQSISDAYQNDIIGPLGLAGIFLAWAFVFGLVLVIRGRVARGAGEILLTLLIAALAATTFVRPAMLLGYDGPIQQTQRAALEAASITANGGNKHPSNDPCDLITGPAQNTCRQEAATTPAATTDTTNDKKHTANCTAVAGPAHDPCLSGERPLAASDVSRPITRTLTDTLVVQPYMLLEYGRSIDKNSPLYKVHKEIIDPQPASTDGRCTSIHGPAKDYCLRRGEDFPANRFNKLGPDGKAAAAYMDHVTWDRVIGALLVLIAVLIIAIVIMAMVLALIAAQFGCVIAATCGCFVFAWAMLPGPNRAVLWKWVGLFASAVVVLFTVAVFIPAFGVAAKVMLANNQTPFMERLFLLDALAVTALAGHRIMLRKGNALGRRFADRMRYARIGGSHTMGENAAATAAAMSSVGYGHSGSGGSSPAHVSFMGRHAGLTAGLRALGDAEGMVGHPGGFLAEARAEGRRALAPLALGARGAHAALIGPHREPRQLQQLGPDGRPLPAKVVDGRTGKLISGGEQQGYIPVGARLEEQLKRTRGGRILVGTSKVAFHTTVGLPATWTRVRRAKSVLTRDLTQEFGRQRRHYSNVAGQFNADTRSGLNDWRGTWTDMHGRPGAREEQ